MFRLALLFSLLLSGIAQANKVLHIGLFHHDEPTEIVMQPTAGTYALLGSGQEILKLDKSSLLRIINEGGSLRVKSLNADYGTFAVVELKRLSWGSALTIQRLDGARKQHEFQDDFTIKPLAGKLRIVNHVFIEHYVAGVVESEAGSREPKEYYKVQAVICRTYALNNRRRHEHEGFELCDKVHCQVYNSRSRANRDIVSATEETSSVVIVDSDINLVTAAFHSNCGGYTCNSEDVWSAELSYLRAKRDPFCLAEPHSYWRYTTSESKWLTYLMTNTNYPLSDKTARFEALNYCPDQRYQSLPANGSPMNSIDFKRIRSDFKLQSAFFSIDHVKDTVVLEGRGYGHGVGLCQEGAMKMCELGMDYDDVLHFYYTGVHLVNLSVIDFFRDED